MKKERRAYRRLTELILLLIITIGLTTLSISSAVAADDTAVEGDGTGNNESYYANTAQLAHATQLAEEAALSSDPAVKTAMSDLESARATGDDAAIKAAENNLDQALADVTGVDDIGAMRASGMGWGEIAHELGVHPSALGLGHNKNRHSYTEQEMVEATARNTQNGFAKGHGANLSSDVSSSSQGKSKDNSSNAKGNKGEKSGKAGDKGDKGNNGNGNGNSGGNGGGNGNGGSKK